VPPKPAILGLVQHAVEPGDRLVGEATGVDDRLWRDRPCGVGRHLERVAVRHAGAGRHVGLGRAVVEDLLARDPRAPRHLAAGAVGVRAAEHRVLLAHAAVAADDELRVAAAHGGIRVVALAGRDRDGDLAGARAVLVVADQDHVAAAALEGRRAVEDPGRRRAVAHRVAGA
jgi:hypothetical protein